MQLEGKEVLIACASAITVVGIMWRLGKFLFVSLTGLVKEYFEAIKEDIKTSLSLAHKNESCILSMKKDITNLGESLRRDVIEVESDVLKLSEDFEKCKDKHDK